MRTIWKFTLQITDMQKVRMPAGAKILSVQKQGFHVCLWAMVNTEQPLETRHIEILGTGNPISEGVGVSRTFIDTVQDGPLVWHIFERM